MIIEVKEITPENIDEILGKLKRSPKKTIVRNYGKLKRGIDGMAYQKTVRNEWS
jgi:hypothetical protein